MSAMITESIREELYQALEQTCPMVKPGAGRKIRTEAAPAFDPLDLSVHWQREFLGLQETLLAELLLHLHTLFAFNEEDLQIQGSVRNALQRIYNLEKACRSDGLYDAGGFALYLFRRYWHETATVQPEALLSGLSHLRKASFFRRIPLELGTWTKQFLLIERFHRLNVREHEERLTRHRLLRSRAGSKTAPFISYFEDLLIWFQFRMLEEGCSLDEDVSRFSHEIATELEGELIPPFLGPHPLQPTIYVLLRTFLLCSAGSIEAAEQRRLDQLGATRQFDSLLDLMRVVINRARQEPGLQEASKILDRLQTDGFNIEHKGFRDPYEAHLVPLIDTEQYERSRLSLFLPLDELTGEFTSDLAMSRRRLADWHTGMVSELIDECEAYALVLMQPLPKASLFEKLVRFATSWTLARSPWPPKPSGRNFDEEVQKLLPANVTRQLVRPRKGYEVKSRQLLDQIIKGEVRNQWEALERIAMSRSIQGFHDYRQLTRYLICQYLQERYGGTPVLGLKDAAAVLREPLHFEWTAEFTRNWGIDTSQVHRYTLESVEDYVKSTVPADRMIPDLKKNFEASENELRRIYHGIVSESAPVFHRLLVASGRQRANLPRLPASLSQIPQMVNLLAPVSDQLKRIVHDVLIQRHAVSGVDRYRNRLRPCLLNASEWKAHLAWQAKKCIENQFRSSERRAQDSTVSIAHFLEIGDLDMLLVDLERAAREVDLPPDGLGWETVRSTLLNLLKPAAAAAEVSEDRIREILRLLPSLDCGACGEPSCRAFSIALLAGRTAPDRCLQLPAHRLPALVEALPRLKVAGTPTTAGESALDLLMDHNLWRGSADREAFQKALSVSVQKGRRLFLERLKEVWDGLTPKPQIFKRPDTETIYRELCRYLGYEATERLREEEKGVLIEHGDERQEAEWQLLKQSQNWLTLVSKRRSGRSLLPSQEGASIAGEAYRNAFFLHLLAPRDRQLVLRFRLENYQDGFSHWWNEDLLTMNHPDFFIRDWEDFSKIINNAYWHQESSAAGGDVLAALEDQPFFENLSNHILTTVLNQWIDDEAVRLTTRREMLRGFRGSAPATISCVAELRDLVQALIDEDQGDQLEPRLNSINLTGTQFLESASNLSTQDRMSLERDRMLERFQAERFTFSQTFSCRWDELLPLEAEALREQFRIENLPEETGTMGANAPTQHSELGSQQYFLADWSEPLQKRSALIMAMLSASIKERRRELEEGTLLRKGDRSSIVTQGSLRLFVRKFLRSGESSAQIEAALRVLLNLHPGSQKNLLRDVLCRVFLKHQCKLLRRPDPTALSLSAAPEGEDFLFAAFPELKSHFTTLCEGHDVMDREKLLHYLFLLAKMEGNIETLTALLREIRETSDIIEAAWLRFTEERITEGPAPRGLPGATTGVPLLHSRIKEKDAVNRGLRDGVSRREKRNIASAVTELLNFVRYHILMALQHHPTEDSIEAVLRDLQEAGYDLSGIEEEALRRAVEKEWRRREQLFSQKIWIYTTVTARRLAAQHTELQKVDREFFKVRLDLLKDGSSDDGQVREIANRRGIALGEIKEALYRQLSDLLEAERIATFQKRIGQIVEQLDQKREEIHEGWLNGEINRRTIFYLLRQYQKKDQEPTWEDFQSFLKDHWFAPLAELRASQRPDREERVQNLDDRFRALVGISLLELEAETTAAANHDFQSWEQGQLDQLEHCCRVF